jgi:hypothetical protein
MSGSGRRWTKSEARWKTEPKNRDLAQPETKLVRPATPQSREKTGMEKINTKEQELKMKT